MDSERRPGRCSGRVVAQLSRLDWSAVKAKKEDERYKCPQQSLFGPAQHGEREREEISRNTPGAILRVDVGQYASADVWLSRLLHTLKMDNTIYDFARRAGGMQGV